VGGANGTAGAYRPVQTPSDCPAATASVHRSRRRVGSAAAARPRFPPPLQSRPKTMPTAG